MLRAVILIFLFYNCSYSQLACYTPFNKASDHNYWAVKFKVLPWTGVITGSGINSSIGFEYGFLKNHSIGFDLFHNRYSFSAGDSFDSTQNTYVGNPRILRYDKAIFLNYRYYIPKLADKNGKAFYLGTFLRYGQLNLEVPADYGKYGRIPPNILKEEHRSIGAMFGMIFQFSCFKNDNQFLGDVYLGIFGKQKVQFIEYYNGREWIQEEDCPYTMGIRVGLTLSLAFKR